MRVLLVLGLAAMVAACFAKHSEKQAPFNSGLLTEPLGVVRTWPPSENLQRVEIEVDSYGSSVTLEREGGASKLVIDFCSPGHVNDRTTFETLMKEKPIDCRWYMGDGPDTCRDAYICKYEGANKDLADLGRDVLNQVYKVREHNVVRYRITSPPAEPSPAPPKP